MMVLNSVVRLADIITSILGQGMGSFFGVGINLFGQWLLCQCLFCAVVRVGLRVFAV